MSAPSPLASWAQARLTALYESNQSDNDVDFIPVFDAAIAQSAQIFLNHAPIPRDRLSDALKDRKFAAARNAVEWRDVIDVPADEPGQETGIVAGCFVVTRSLKFRIRAGPAQTHTHVVFSAKVEEDSAAENGDRRRIVHLLLTSVDKAAQIHIRGGPSA